MYGRSALIVCLATAGLLASSALAQGMEKMHYGVRGGVNLANLSVDNLPDEESTSIRTAFQAGGVLECGVTDNVAVGAGLDDLPWLAETLGRPVHDPFTLYRQQQDRTRERTAS